MSALLVKASKQRVPVDYAALGEGDHFWWGLEQCFKLCDDRFRLDDAPEWRNKVWVHEIHDVGTEGPWMVEHLGFVPTATFDTAGLEMWGRIENWSFATSYTRKDCDQLDYAYTACGYGDYTLEVSPDEKGIRVKVYSSDGLVSFEVVTRGSGLGWVADRLLAMCSKAREELV
jgi:hypothetical protein